MNSPNANNLNESMEVTITGNAANTFGSSSTRKNRRGGAPKRGLRVGGEPTSLLMPDVAFQGYQRGGDNTGALMQLSADRVPPAFRRGGDNSGALLGLAAQSLQNMKMRGGDNSGGVGQVSWQSVQGLPGQAVPTDILNNQGNGQAAADAYKAAMNQLPLLQASLKGMTGGDLTAGTINIASSRAPITPGAPAVRPVVSGVPVEQPAPPMLGGVLLKPAKKRVHVSLKAPKKGAAHASTRKAPRKIRLGVKGMKTRLNRAKKATAHARTASLPVVRQRLVRAGVIKPSSKAPESMLRSMYADLLVTKKGL